MSCKHKNTIAIYIRERYTKENPQQKFVKVPNYRYCTDCEKIIRVEPEVVNGN